MSAPPSSGSPTTAMRLRVGLDDLIRENRGRRHIAVRCHLGEPGGILGVDRIDVVGPGDADAALRADLLEAALVRLDAADPLVWITRSGPLSATDPDLAWFAAARAAFGRVARRWPGFHVLTRSGWLRLDDGTSMVWSRIRVR